MKYGRWLVPLSGVQNGCDGPELDANRREAVCALEKKHSSTKNNIILDVVLRRSHGRLIISSVLYDRS